MSREKGGGKLYCGKGNIYVTPRQLDGFNIFVSKEENYAGRVGRKGRNKNYPLILFISKKKAHAFPASSSNRSMRAQTSNSSPTPEPDNMAGLSAKRRSRMKISSGRRDTRNHGESPKCKPSLASMLFSLSLPNSSNKNTFRGLGCTSAPDVHNPSSAHSLVRPSADWNAKKLRQKPTRTSSEGGRKKKTQVVDSDVWCSPGIPFSTDADSVDCVIYRRPAEPVTPKRISRHHRSGASDFTYDVDSKHRECPSLQRSAIGRPNNTLERNSELSSLPAFETPSPMSYRYLRGLHHTSGDLAELVMVQTSLILGKIDICDRFREWRFDVDNMTYEELLELGDRIGYVNTGLNDDQIAYCVKKVKHSASLVSHLSSEQEKKCSICQEEYEGKTEVGKLNCGHYFHICCIKQWLLQKNACPVCKLAAATNH